MEKKRSVGVTIFAIIFLLLFLGDVSVRVKTYSHIKQYNIKGYKFEHTKELIKNSLKNRLVAREKLLLNANEKLTKETNPAIKNIYSTYIRKLNLEKELIISSSKEDIVDKNSAIIENYISSHWLLSDYLLSFLLEVSFLLSAIACFTLYRRGRMIVLFLAFLIFLAGLRWFYLGFGTIRLTRPYLTYIDSFGNILILLLATLLSLLIIFFFTRPKVKEQFNK